MVQLDPMTKEEFTDHCEHAIPAYAAEKVLAGSWSLEESLPKSHEAYAELLPLGLATKDHFLFTIRRLERPESVGVIWLANDSASSPASGFIYELWIEEDHRRQGAARSAMLAVEEKARALGLQTLRLHVFGQNRIAWLLYEKLGYEVTDINMAKSLD